MPEAAEETVILNMAIEEDVEQAKAAIGELAAPLQELRGEVEATRDAAQEMGADWATANQRLMQSLDDVYRSGQMTAGEGLKVAEAFDTIWAQEGKPEEFASAIDDLARSGELSESAIKGLGDALGVAVEQGREGSESFIDLATEGHAASEVIGDAETMLRSLRVSLGAVGTDPALRDVVGTAMGLAGIIDVIGPALPLVTNPTIIAAAASAAVFWSAYEGMVVGALNQLATTQGLERELVWEQAREGRTFWLGQERLDPMRALGYQPPEDVRRIGEDLSLGGYTMERVYDPTKLPLALPWDDPTKGEEMYAAVARQVRAGGKGWAGLSEAQKRRMILNAVKQIYGPTAYQYLAMVEAETVAGEEAQDIKAMADDIAARRIAEEQLQERTIVAEQIAEDELRRTSGYIGDPGQAARGPAGRLGVPALWGAGAEAQVADAAVRARREAQRKAWLNVQRQQQQRREFLEERQWDWRMEQPMWPAQREQLQRYREQRERRREYAESYYGLRETWREYQQTTGVQGPVPVRVTNPRDFGEAFKEGRRQGQSGSYF